jgi:hypothetical protein
LKRKKELFEFVFITKKEKKRIEKAKIEKKITARN